MITFLPYPDYRESAKVLDYKRLGKSRVECLQIVNVLTGLSRGWGRHPATRMWTGYTDSLIVYGLTICNEWVRRGYKDTVWDKLKIQMVNLSPPYPPWLGEKYFHSTHRSNLLSKDPVFYSRYGWTDSRHLRYFWPDPTNYLKERS